MCEHRSSFGWCGIKDMPVCGPVAWVTCSHGGLVYALTFTALALGFFLYYLTAVL